MPPRLNMGVQMRKYSFGFMYFLATILVAFVAGCGVETVSIPGVISVTPAPGATGVAINATISATFNVPMSAGSITTTTFTVQSPGGVTVAGSVALSSNGLIATFTPTGGTLAYETTYTATITTGAATPGGAELVSDYVWSFTTIAPTALTVAVTPAPFAQNVVLTAPITATFSQAMNCATLASPATTFTVTAPGDVAVVGTVTCSGSVATFTPAGGALPSYDTTYTATITTGATDLIGYPLAGGNYVWTFTTLALPPAITLPPTVISTNPVTPDPTSNPVVPEDVTVPLNQAVSATFSEPMDPGTIIGANFTLTYVVSSVTTYVSGIVAYAPTNNALVFTPSANLLPTTTYTATISTGVQDVALQPMASSYTWIFETGTTTSATPPEVVSTVPASAATNVPLNQAVSATFTEAMNPLTLTTTTFLLYEGTSASGTPLPATITYDPVNFIATLTPTSPLIASTHYTALVTTGATDLAGNPLVAGPVPNPWTFETGAAIFVPPVVLGPTISLFGGFSGSAGMTNTGTLTVINGDSGTTATDYSSYTGFHDDSVLLVVGGFEACSYTETGSNIGLVTGTIYSPLISTSTFCPLEGTAADIAIADEALAEATTAYGTLQGLPATGALAAEIGGTTIYPGVYDNATSVGITAGDLTLDAQGDPNAYFVFQIGTTLTVGLPGSPVNVILAGGAKASHIFWVVAGTGVYLEPSGGGTFNGTIIASNFIHVSTAGNVAVVTVNGRLISLNASTTLVDTVINVPPAP
jgi:Ice-binding-like/Bacterial Ig-like domain